MNKPLVIDHRFLCKKCQDRYTAHASGECNQCRKVKCPCGKVVATNSSKLCYDCRRKRVAPSFIKIQGEAIYA
jgi:hypothetical protein